MSDDLSPAEQARAARWAADWLTAQSVETGVPGVIALLHKAADRLDPPRETSEDFRRYWLKACADLDAANDTIARLRATHTEQIEHMKWRWLKDARERSMDLFLAKNPLPSSEAARGRCSRED